MWESKENETTIQDRCDPFEREKQGIFQNVSFKCDIIIFCGFPKKNNCYR